MGYGAPKLSRQEVAEAISDTDTYYTISGKEFTIDSAFYGRVTGRSASRGTLRTRTVRSTTWKSRSV